MIRKHPGQEIRGVDDHCYCRQSASFGRTGVEDIKAGDVVVLKSGSRAMTVQWVGADKTCGVVWADREGVHHTANYNVTAVKKDT